MCKQITILVTILVLVLTAGVQADLEGYWRFDEGSGGTAHDSSVKGRDGTISGAAWYAGGWDGWCLDFDGDNDVVELGAFDVVGPGITLAAWIKPDDFEITGSRIITKADEYGYNDHWWMLGPYPLSSEQRLRFRLKTTDGLLTTTLIASSGTLVAGQWQHIAATWDGATMRVYLNGVQTGSVAKGGAAVATDANVKVAIGSQPSDAFDTDPLHVNRFFDGLMDEVIIYNEGLSALQIQDLIDGVLPGIGPANDDCDDAKPVGDVTDMAFDTSDATFDGPGHCLTSPNIWYCYTASCTGDATVSLAGSSFDTMLAVYDGCECYPASQDLIECNDDDGVGYQSAITFAVTTGSQYLIEIGGYSTETGEGLLNISCEDQGVPPSKDDCDDAKPVGDVTDLPFDTTNATFDGPGHCLTSPNTWFCYTASCTGDATVSLAGSSYDTMLAVYDGCECYPASQDLIECNDDDGVGYQSAITFAVTTGSQYLIEVGGYSTETGEGLLTISCEEEGVPPSKDDCDDAKPVGDVTDLPFDTTNATFDGPGHCLTSPNTWYCYTASCTGDVTVSLAGSSYDTMLAVYDGCECYPASQDLIECNDDDGGNYQSAITFAATVGSQYLIEVGGYASEKGAGLLTISCEGVVVQNKTDLGDAPDSTNNSGVTMTAYPSQGTLPVVFPAKYPTVYNDGTGTGPYGPVHLNDQTVAFLGKKITRETEADTGADEDGVNNIRPSSDRSDRDQGDEGVVTPLRLPDCRWTTFDYLVTIVDPNVDLYVNVWLDWNRDGDWDDTLECPEGSAMEWAVQNQLLINLPIGLNQITSKAVLPWYPENGREDIWMRITLSGQPWRGGSNPGVVGNAGSGPQEKYAIGETEDYYFTPDTTCLICEDYNGDGVIDMNDLVAYTAEWLETCQ